MAAHRSRVLLGNSLWQALVNDTTRDDTTRTGFHWSGKRNKMLNRRCRTAQHPPKPEQECRDEEQCEITMTFVRGLLFSSAHRPCHHVFWPSMNPQRHTGTTLQQKLAASTENSARVNKTIPGQEHRNGTDANHMARGRRPSIKEHGGNVQSSDAILVGEGAQVVGIGQHLPARLRESEK